MKIREILHNVLNENQIDSTFEEVLEKNRNLLNAPLINYMMNGKFLYMNSSVTYGVLEPSPRRMGPFEPVVNEIFEKNSINALPTKSFEVSRLLKPEGYKAGGNPCFVFPLRDFSFFTNKNNKGHSFKNFVNNILGTWYKNTGTVPDEFVKTISNAKYKKEFLNEPDIYFFRVDVLKLNDYNREDFEQKIRLILKLLNKQDEFVNKKINKRTLNNLLREFLQEVVLRSDEEIKHVLDERGMNSKTSDLIRDMRTEFIKQNSTRILNILYYNMSDRLEVSDDLKAFLENELISGALYKNNVKGIDPDFTEYLDNYVLNPVLITGPCLFISYHGDKRMKLLDKLKKFIQ